MSRVEILSLIVGIYVIISSVVSTTPPSPSQNPMRDVSHEDIRDAILSLVHMFRDNTDKLERHEYRERQLGDQLKKSLGSIEKKQKSDEASTNQYLEMFNVINQKLGALESAILKEKNAPVPDTSSSFQQSIQKKIDNIEQSIQRNELVMESIRSNSIQKLETILSNTLQSQSSIGTLGQKLDSQSTSNENRDLLTKFENKLNTIESLNDNFEKLAPLQQSTLEQISQIQMSLAEGRGKETCNCQLSSSIIEKFDEIKSEIQRNYENNTIRSQEQTEKTQIVIDRGYQSILSAITESTISDLDGNKNIDNKYDQLLKEIKGLSKIDQVLIQTADNVLDTKRRIEYGTHQILLEVGELIRISSKETNDTVNRRFDMISSEILNNTNGALQNLSSKLETEISQVWRQIGIMYQTLTNSADALDKLQQQTEIYVNGSLSTMDNMEGKVGLITSRMSEVDDNLNYLLGRLSLVTQEFNQIKTGLGQALDNIRSSFHTVQDKVKDAGPGPNPIEEEQEIVDNPLQKTKYIVS